MINTFSLVSVKYGINHAAVMGIFARAVKQLGMVLVYVIAWVAVVFEIDCASNAGRKLVILRGAASTIRAINSKYYSKICY